MSPYPGLSLLRTENGVAFVDLDITAEPKMRNDPTAHEALRRRFTSEALYEREIGRKAYALSGASVFPEFDPGIHVIPHERIPAHGCCFMALDPHPRTPHAALWVLIDAWHDWYVYRELWPSKIYGRGGRISDDDRDNQYTTREYVETIAELLEGNEIEWHNPETSDEYGIYRRWFNPETKVEGERIIDRFMDQAGKGFVVSEVGNETYSTRYQKYGLSFSDPRKDHAAGEDAIRQLLKPRHNDVRGIWPQLHVSDRCVEFCLEIRQHRYEVMKQVRAEKELRQDRSKFRCHLVDCLRYIATGNVSYIPSMASARYESRSGRI